MCREERWYVAPTTTNPLPLAHTMYTAHTQCTHHTGMAAHGYDLYAVSHHFGNMVGGHYTATCMVPPLSSTGSNGNTSAAQWWTFNDEHVSRIAPRSVVSNTAYMLFYVRRDCLQAAAAQLEGARAAALVGGAHGGA